MNSFKLLTICFSTFILFPAPVVACEHDNLVSSIQLHSKSSQKDPLLVFKTFSGVSVSVPSQSYFNLIDGKVDEITTQKYKIRHRLGTDPVGFRDGDTNLKLYTVFLDVFDKNTNQPIGTWRHGHPRTVESISK